MRFGFVHRLMTDALATLGVLALVASGQFTKVVSAILIVALAGALAVRESWHRKAFFRYLDTGALLGVLGLQIVRVLMDASVLDAVIEFAAALQIIRLATRRGAAHDQQVIVLALLHLIAGTVLGGGLGYGLCFLGVLVVAPGALVLSHLRREVEGNYRQGARDRTGLPVDVPRILRSRRVVGRPFLAVTCLLSIPIFVFTAVLFVLFPRVGLSLLLMNRPHGGRMVGFSGKVDLGEVGVLRTDPTLALRVDLSPAAIDLLEGPRRSVDPVSGPAEPPSRITLHLRGTALDSYDGRAWTQSEAWKRPAESDGGVIELQSVVAPDDPVVRIDLEPIDPPVVFIPQTASGLRFRSRGQIGLETAPAYRGPEGEVRYQPMDERGLKYDVFLSQKKTAAFQKLAPSERPRYLTLPPNLPARVRALAEEWTQDAKTPEEKADAIQRHLRTGFKYDLGSPSGRAEQPLDDFLFESKRGHCEFYSTAMAVLLRAVSVPTRNVTGFIGGSYNQFGKFYAVRQGDAHSWVEVFIDSYGWKTFDPTPPGDAAPKSELGGAWGLVRDFLEAVGQRWDRHVVGYDFNQQVSLYELFTKRHGGPTISRASAPGAVKVMAVLLGLATGAGVVVIYLRRRKRGAPRIELPGEARTRAALLATELYERLDAAMRARGVGRPPGVPPLKHAEALNALGHPLADEILDLTSIYLDARFGTARLTANEKKLYEDRVRALRAAILPAPKTESP